MPETMLESCVRAGIIKVPQFEFLTHFRSCCFSDLYRGSSRVLSQNLSQVPWPGHPYRKGLGSQKVVVYVRLCCKYDREWFFSSMCLQPCGQCITSLFYEGHCKGKPWVMYAYLFTPSKAPPLSSSFDPKWSGKRVFGKIAAAQQFLSNLMQSS